MKGGRFHKNYEFIPPYHLDIASLFLLQARLKVIII